MPKSKPPTHFFTYLLECADGTYYCGWTTDPERRVSQHNQGSGARYTRTRRPVTLKALWQFPSKPEAMQFEYTIKQLSRHQKAQLIDAQGLTTTGHPQPDVEQMHPTATT